MRKNSLREDLKIIKIGFREIYKLQAWVLPITIMNAFFKSTAPFVNIYMTARIIDQLLGPRDMDRLVFLVGITIGLNLVIHLISTGLEHLRDMLRDITMQNQHMRLNEKIISMDYEHIENPEIHSLRTKIAESENMNGGGIYVLLNRTGDLVKGIVTVLTSIGLVMGLFTADTAGGYLSFINTRLFSYGFLALILTGTIFSLKLVVIADRKYFSYFSKIMDLNRIFSFYYEQALDYNAGKEIRLYKQKDLFNKEIDSFHQEAGRVVNTVGYMNARYGGASALISSLLGGLVYVFVGLKAIAGAITIGSIVQYTGSIHQLISGCTEILTSINLIRNNNQYLQLYMDFLNIEGEKYKGTIPVEKRNDNEYEIEFKNVSFKYPGTEEYVLKNISLKLRIGQKLAIVGMNGSGKTTFIKLLCRLYDPNEGEILLNGINIKKYNYEEYLSLFSIVFQDFKLFSFSLGQNIATSVDYDEGEVRDALVKAGLENRFNTMPKGLKTSLYKDFDEAGVEISGGEAQKIALARALYRNAPIIILDEPTAALDPIAEFEVYSRFNEMVGGKTAFYISHRLSSCRFCDEIAVFHEGRIVQRGSHEMLLQDKDGKYYELWHSQAQYYKEEVSA